MSSSNWLPIRSRRIVRMAGGLSLVELMISLAITSLLLTAVAAAFSASTAAIEDNDQFFRASQAARVAMNQMLTQLRRSDVIDVPTTSTRIDFTGDDLIDRSFVYEYDATAKKGTLKLLVEKNGVVSSYVLCRDIAAMTIQTDVVHPESGSGDYVVRVTLNITVEIGNSRIHLTGSAAPRRVQIYN